MFLIHIVLQNADGSQLKDKAYKLLTDMFYNKFESSAYRKCILNSGWPPPPPFQMPDIYIS